MSSSASFIEHFSEVTEPRRGEPVYPLQNILFIAVCAVISGADDFVAIAKFGRTKIDWFAKYLDLSAGIPSHDRFNAILAQIRPAEFEQCLLNWITSLQEISDGQIVAIDGKTLRRSYDKASGKSAIHMVSAWATANHISLGQVVVEEEMAQILRMHAVGHAGCVRIPRHQVDHWPPLAHEVGPHDRRPNQVVGA